MNISTIRRLSRIIFIVAVIALSVMARGMVLEQVAAGSERGHLTHSAG